MVQATVCSRKADCSSLMSMSCPRVFALAVAALSAGCSFADDALLPHPTLDAVDPRGPEPARAAAPPAPPPAPPAPAQAPAAAAAPRASSTSTSVSTVAPSQPTNGKI